MTANPGLWVHGHPARDLAQVESYLSGDAHDRSKVQWFDGERFHRVQVGSDIGPEWETLKETLT